MSNWQNITFGIELELFVPKSKWARIYKAGKYHNGNPMPGLENWRMDADASIRASEGYVGVELVSPILQGEEGLAEVFGVVEWFSQFAKYNRSCGMHVHIGISDSIERAQFVGLFRALESAIYGLCGSEAKVRANNPYCLPIDAPQPRAARYHSLNQTHSNRLEVRAFDVRLEAEIVVTRVMALLAMTAQCNFMGTQFVESGKPILSQVLILNSILATLPEGSELVPVVYGLAEEAIQAGFEGVGV